MGQGRNLKVNKQTNKRAQNENQVYCVDMNSKEIDLSKLSEWPHLAPTSLQNMPLGHMGG
jgi:hypothetical protein